MTSRFVRAPPGQSHRHPEGSVNVVKAWPGALLLQDPDLLPQGDVLEHQLGPRPTSYPKHSEDDCVQQDGQPEHSPRRLMESGLGCYRQPF